MSRRDRLTARMNAAPHDIRFGEVDVLLRSEDSCFSINAAAIAATTTAMADY